MKKQLLLFVMMMLPMVASADAVKINGIYYNLITKAKIAEVTSDPNCYSGSVVIPESVTYENVNYSVTNIGDMAFYYCSGLTSVTIPNSVTSIGESTFYGCSGLITVTIPNSVTSIGKCVFMNCRNLTSVTIPNSVTSIGEQAFSGCSALTSVTIPNSVTSIEERVFYNCFCLTSFTIPNSVTSIGKSAFYYCSGLTSVTIPNSVTSIDIDAFENCSSLTSVNISDVAAWCKISFLKYDSNPLYFAHHLYLNGEEVKDLIIPNSVTNIGEFAFEGCSNLTSVTIGNNVTSIGLCAFAGCTGLNSVTIPNSVTSIEYSVFEGCSGLASINIPNSITDIRANAFQGCSGLTSVAIPNSVTNIGWNAFEGCSGLTSVTIGSGIGYLESKTFANCPELKDVYCHAINVPNTHADAFKDSYTDYATLHVPAESVNAYKVAEPWKNFKSIVSLEGGDTPEPPEPQKCEKPTISYNNGQLKFASATDGAEFVSEISDSDIKKNYEAIVNLTATYNISVYATKDGYDNSETATATLCWIDKEPKAEGITDGVAEIPSKPVLIQSEGGILKVEGIDEGTKVAVYTPDGKQVGSAISCNGAALVGTNIQPGNTAIVKIGEKAVKIFVK